VPPLVSAAQNNDDIEASMRLMREEERATVAAEMKNLRFYADQEEERAAVAAEMKNLRFYAEQVEAENKMLRELVDNQKNDIECLLKLSDKVRIDRSLRYKSVKSYTEDPSTSLLSRSKNVFTVKQARTIKLCF
jgi:hypothetical protein